MCLILKTNYTAAYKHMDKKELTMTAKRATRKDVALEANVSETIVSYVVNNNRYVDAEKRKRVEEAIKKLNYVPNSIARTLKGKSSFHIMFIADKIDNEHFGRLVRKMDEFAYDRGYLISLCANRNDDEFIRNIINRQVDGVIINSISFSEDYVQKIVDANIPVVLFANKIYTNQIEEVGYLYTGLYQGAKKCIAKLSEEGRKNILYIDRISRQSNFSDMTDLRFRGYVNGLKACGLEYSEENFITGCHNEEEIIEKVTKRLQKGDKIDAILGRNDHIALLTMLAVKESGFKVPDDIAIVGFDNSIASKLSDPALSTIEIDRDGLAKEAIEMLTSLVNNNPAYKKEFETTFIKREST